MSKRGEPLSERERKIIAGLEADGHRVETCYDGNGNRSFRVIKAKGKTATIHTNAGGGVELFNMPPRPVRGVEG